MPEGTYVTVFGEHGATISDAAGGLIDQGILPQVEEVIGARTYLPGAQMPNYTLYPATGLNIMGNPVTVSTATNLSEMLVPYMRQVWWGACLGGG